MESLDRTSAKRVSYAADVTVVDVTDEDDGSEFGSAKSEFELEPPPPPPMFFNGRLPVDLAPLPMPNAFAALDFPPPPETTKSNGILGESPSTEADAPVKPSPPAKKADDSTVKVLSIGRKTRNFTYLLRTQQFLAHEGGVTLLRFNKSSTRIATAGIDLIIKIWRVRMVSDLESQVSEIAKTVNEEDAERNGSSSPDPRLNYASLSLIEEEAPLIQLAGHEADVKDISWSQNNFLLSSSNDRTVRLWHPELSSSSLKVFTHPHFVNCVSFNPRDESVFVSGCSDGYVRLFAIQPSPVLLQESSVRGIATSVAIDDSGTTAILGTAKGHINFFHLVFDGQTWRLRLKAQQEIAERKAKGSEIKVNSVSIVSSQYIVSCNDSVLRRYHLKDNTLLTQCKGHRNSIHLGASPTSDGNFVLVGSEPNNVYIYDIGLCSNKWGREISDGKRALNKSPEHFRANDNRLNCAQFFPRRIRPWVRRTPTMGRSQSQSSSDNFMGPETQLLSPSPWGQPTTPMIPLSEPPRNPGRFGQSMSDAQKPNSLTKTLSASGLFIVAASLDGSICVFYNVGIDLKTLAFLS